MDVSDTHFLQFHRDTSGFMELGDGPANFGQQGESGIRWRSHMVLIIYSNDPRFSLPLFWDSSSYSESSIESRSQHLWHSHASTSCRNFSASRYHKLSNLWDKPLTIMKRPASLLALLCTTLLTTLFAITLDTTFYNPNAPLLSTLLQTPTITPLNSLLYNSQTTNLASHGLHPHYQHLIASLPLLLGPSLPLLLTSPKQKSSHLPLLSALSGTAFLSCIPHQEPRFLLPAVPLILSSIHLPRSKTRTRYWLASWMIFNAGFGVLMGVYHQGGVVPVQIWLGQQKDVTANMNEVLWWRTYSPPIWLLDHNPIKTTDLMGIPFLSLQSKLRASFSANCDPTESVGLVAPYSSTALDELAGGDDELEMEGLWRYSRHLNLDDLDFGEEGVWRTVNRVLGRRGLVVWRIRRKCTAPRGQIMQGDW